MKDLKGYQKKYLRGLAHSLSPLVQVGHEGISKAVIKAIKAALLDHELIKVKMKEPEDKKLMADQLAKSTGACLCGLLGHTAILYQPHPEKPEIKIPQK